MSNVTLQEILMLSATEFAVPTHTLGSTHRSNGRGPRPPSLEARSAYLYLARRHTSEPWEHVFGALQLGHARFPKWMVDELSQFEERLERDKILANRIARIEDGIDACHERRMGEKSRQRLRRKRRPPACATC